MTPQEQTKAYAQALVTYRHDPLGFVLWAYPWGKEGTILEDESGPDVWQRAELVALGEHLAREAKAKTYAPYRGATASGHGIGKAQALDDVAYTPSGLRRWGDLKAGDCLIGADGRPTVIRATTRYPACPMMRVTFDDGASLDVSTGHLWNVRGRRERRRGLTEWQTLETCEIARLGVKRPNGKAMARQWEVPIQEPAQFDAQETAVHPYLAGIWLGDGSKAQPRWTKPCPEIADKVRSLGYEVRSGAKGDNYVTCVRPLFQSGTFALNSHERYIPDEYKFNDIDARRAMLEGLLDADGEVHHSGSIGYSSTSERLARDVIWLARSLGCKAMMQKAVVKSFYYNSLGEKVPCRECWRVTINAPFNPFTHPAKAASYKPSEARYLTRWIDSIEPIGHADAMCVTVAAPDGLYQARDFIVTHNSAQTTFVVHWALSTCRNAKGVVTANSDTQLRTKTWAEVTKWWDLHVEQFPIAKHFFECTASAFRAKANPATWAINAIPNNPRNAAAFAGMHNAGSRVLILFDEAAGIEPVIWETADGAMTDKDTELIFLSYGNPIYVSGRFKEVVDGKFKRYWNTTQIDSRTVKRTNKAELQKWLEAYGEDSDFFRTRVRGLFPVTGSTNLISTAVIAAARKRETFYEPNAPLVAGLDVARFGDDDSVLRFRQGRDAKSRKRIKWKGANSTVLAREANRVCLEQRVHTLFVDVGGVGAGVYDQLVMLANGAYNVIPIDFGSGGGLVYQNGIKARAYNKRASMYLEMAEWMQFGCIEDDNDLESELVAIKYSYARHDGSEIILEPKALVKKDLGRSPDDADALALTFGAPIAPSHITTGGNGSMRSGQNVSSLQAGFDDIMRQSYEGI